MPEKRLSKMNEKELCDMSINIKLTLAKMLADQMGLNNAVCTIHEEGGKERCLRTQ